MIKILIADDHAIVREGLKQILADQPDMAVAGEATNGNETISRIRNDDWDVVLLDMAMPGRNGIDVLKLIRAEKPQLPVLVLSMYPEDQYAMRSLKAGAAGYLTKNAAPNELVTAIKKVASGEKYISISLAEKLADKFCGDYENSPHELLSDREYQIFQLFAEGNTVSDIANHLSLSVKTVSTHRAHILKKLRLKNNAALMRYAFENQLVQ